MSTENGEQKIHLLDRSQLEATGVINVESFDDKKIILETVQGMLNLHGEGLHIKSLNLENGMIRVEGRFDSMVYSEISKGVKERSKGFLEKILR